MSKEAREWLGKQENLGRINWYEVMQAYADQEVKKALKEERERIVEALWKGSWEWTKPPVIGVNEAIKIVNDEIRRT